MRGGLLFARRILLGERVRKSHRGPYRGYSANPKYVEAYVYRGIAHWHKGDHDKAIVDYTEAIRLDEKFNGAYWGRGWAYEKKGEYDKAIADFREAIRLNPENAEAYFSRALAYGDKGDHDKAIADFSEAIRLNPKKAKAYYGRGTAYYHEGEYDKAIADYTEAIRLDPKDAVAYCNRGAAYDGKGKHDKAIADYTEAIRLDPTDAFYYRARGSIYANTGDKSRANEDLERFRRIGLESLLHELNLPPAREQPQASVEALEKRIKDQVKRLEYNDEVAGGVVTLVRDWNLIALSQKLAAARKSHEQGKLSQQQLVTVEQEVAETLARLIAAVILPDDDLSKGHELTDVVHDKTGCCQGDSLLYFVLGNSIGLSVRGLDVRIAARESLPSGKSHVANLVSLSDGFMVIVNVTRQLGHETLISKAFRFDDVYRRYGTYWELRDKSNPLALHRVVQPLDAPGLTAGLYASRTYECVEKGDYDKAIAESTKAIRLNPKDAEPYNRRGLAFLSKGDCDKAIADHTEAIRLYPADTRHITTGASPT